MRNFQRQRAATRLEREKTYAAIHAEAAPLEERIRRARAEGMDEVTIDDFKSQQKPFRPKRQPDENRADRLRAVSYTLLTLPTKA